MNSDYVLYLARQALQTALLLSAPVLIVCLVVGALTAMFQAVTSIKDQTIGMVLKLLAVGVTLLISGNWMMQLAIKHTRELFEHVAAMGH
jgi:flagellar biosynthetic protein FliQ